MKIIIEIINKHNNSLRLCNSKRYHLTYESTATNLFRLS